VKTWFQAFAFKCNLCRYSQVVIFVKSVQRCTYLDKLLQECNFPSIAIHRGMSQEERLARYKSFKVGLSLLSLLSSLFSLLSSLFSLLSLLSSLFSSLSSLSQVECR
jgi:hypothetical protein